MIAFESGMILPSISTSGKLLAGSLANVPVTASYFWSVSRRYVSTLMTKGLASGSPKAGPNLWSLISLASRRGYHRARPRATTAPSIQRRTDWMAKARPGVRDFDARPPGEAAMSDALVLAGAVVKGAFTAGALSVLSEPDTQSRIGLDVARIVGASSGGLNGTFYAAAIRSGDEAAAGQRLVQVWLDDATFFGTFNLSLRDIAGALGLSTESKVATLLRRHIAPASGLNPIELRLVVTNTDGEPIEMTVMPPRPSSTSSIARRPTSTAPKDSSASSWPRPLRRPSPASSRPSR